MMMKMIKPMPLTITHLPYDTQRVTNCYNTVSCM